MFKRTNNVYPKAKRSGAPNFNNSNTVGVTLICGEQYQKRKQPLPTQQVASAVKIGNALRKAYSIRSIYGHAEIQTNKPDGEGSPAYEKARDPENAIANSYVINYTSLDKKLNKKCVINGALPQDVSRLNSKGKNYIDDGRKLIGGDSNNVHDEFINNSSPFQNSPTPQQPQQQSQSPQQSPWSQQQPQEEPQQQPGQQNPNKSNPNKPNNQPNNRPTTNNNSNDTYKKEQQAACLKKRQEIQNNINGRIAKYNNQLNNNQINCGSWKDWVNLKSKITTNNPKCAPFNALMAKNHAFIINRLNNQINAINCAI